jgi:hypothetical protein
MYTAEYLRHKVVDKLRGRAIKGVEGAHLSAFWHAHQICFRACSSIGENKVRPFVCHVDESRWRPRSIA